MQEKTDYDQKTEVGEKGKKKKTIWKWTWIVVRIADWVCRLIAYFEDLDG
ncbi:hypothetical protein [Marinomonas pollencensis]|uniref:Uncharacterized protein n=1 Tax=Marinomonas pollencensis TaxID=491954 RepID=A0A3E0DGW1_9GAMM|nr:hypothetical protein [Marinomonas pollencensis]REG81948.1 hypothetical protein DFP81_11128 [Marinomonas pollencensis]